MLRMLKVVLMVMELLVVVMLLGVGVLSKLRAVVDIVFLVGGRVRLGAIKGRMMLVMVLVVDVNGLRRGGEVRGGRG